MIRHLVCPAIINIVANMLWAPIISNDPDLFIWGGDIIYSDTEDMKFMKKLQQMKNDSLYPALEKSSCLGTWDDHDYGLNDGGANYTQER